MTGQKWRFTGCVIILGIRLVVSGITFFIKRKGGAKEKTSAKMIAGSVMSIFLIGFALFPAFIFTGYTGLKTTGQYEVKETQAILIDNSRLETNENDGSNREIPIHFYYPESDAANCPLVLFAHGSFGYYQSNSSLYFELASNGYVVASIDHPYYAFFTKDTKGKTIIVDFAFMQTAVNMQTSSDYTETKEDFNTICEWMSIRTADENFVLDTIKAAKNSGALDGAWYTRSEDAKAEILGALEMTDTEKIGLMGHSIGGAEHMDFTDLPLFAPPLAKMLGKGDVDSSEFIPEINSIILNYFNYYLKGEGEPNIESWNAQTAENSTGIL